MIYYSIFNYFNYDFNLFYFLMIIKGVIKGYLITKQCFKLIVDLKKLFESNNNLPKESISLNDLKII